MMNFDELLGYASVLTYLVDNGLSVYNNDDIKDAFVAITKDFYHMTDEDLVEATQEFRISYNELAKSLRD